MSPPAQSSSYRESPPPAQSAARSVGPPPSDPVSMDNVSSPGTSSGKYSTDSKKVARVHASGVTRTVSYSRVLLCKYELEVDVRCSILLKNVQHFTFTTIYKNYFLLYPPCPPPSSNSNLFQEVRPLARPSSQVVVSHTTTTKLRRSVNRTRRSISKPRALAPSPNHVIFASGPNPCSGCPGADKDTSTGGVLLQLARSLDTVSF